jgi:RHS repeat-associated protein
MVLVSFNTIERYPTPTTLTTKVDYDDLGRASWTRDPMGGESSFEYLPTGELTKRTDPVGVIGYRYDKNSNLVQFVDGNSNATNYSYNEWNVRFRVTEPAIAGQGSADFSTYVDAGGLPVSESSPGGATTTSRAFNSLGHLSSESSTGTSLTTVTKAYTTDALGRVTAVGSLGFAYNDRNELVSSSGSGNDATFAYDANGRLASKTQPWSAQGFSAVSFGYNARGDVTSIADPFSGTRTQGFNAAGQKTLVTHGATRRDIAYDPIGRLASDSLKNASTNAVLNQVSYSYDVNDNPTGKTIASPGNGSAGVHSYAYDAVDRLVSWSNQAGAATTYGYDKAGNRVSAGSGTYTYDTRNRLLTGPGASFSWTPRGTPVTQTVAGVTSTFTTDAADRITGVSKTGSALTYVPDELDRTKTRTLNGAATGFSYSGFETDPTAQGTDVLFARGVSGELLGDRTGTGVTHAVGLDGHRDVTHWYSAATAAVTDSKQYDPFGVVASAVGSGSQLATTGFQGDWTDPTTGDVNMGARWYNPGTATFRTRDTYFGQLSTPFSLNRYTYGLNNPARYSDSTGHYTESEIFGAVDLSGMDWSGLGLNVAPVVQREPEYANPSAGVYVNVTYGNDGSSTISVVSAGGVVVSTPATTERSGNLSFTPNESFAEVAAAALQSGHTATAIAIAANDAVAAAVAGGTEDDATVDFEGCPVPDSASFKLVRQ